MYLAEKLYPGLQIVEWPDKSNARTSDIDAIAEAAGKRIAIEHTSADYITDQRRHDERFMKAIGGLEEELQGQIDCHLRLIIPFGSVPTGMSWDGIQEQLRRWILHDVPHLAYDKVHQNIEIEGVPFLLTAQKSDSGTNGLFLARSVIEATSFPQRLQSLIDRKALKLAQYRDSCNLLILLIENADIANMSRGKMMKAVETSYPQSLPSGLDRVWYADSSIPESIQCWNITPASRVNMILMNASEELKQPPE